MMPALPLLASEVEAPDSTGEGTKNIPRRLRRKNPPPSLFTNHQKLPSATSSTISLPKSRPSSSRSTKPPSSGWFSRAGGRKSMDTSDSKNEWLITDEFRAVPYSVGLGSKVGHGGVLTPPGSSSPTTNQGSEHPYIMIGMDPNRPSHSTSARFTGGLGKAMARPNSTSETPANGVALSPPPVPPRSDNLDFGDPSDQNGVRLSETRPKARSVPIDVEFLLPPTAPFAASPSSLRSSSGSPVLPPLPLFQSGDFGFVTAPSSISSLDLLRKDIEKPPLSPKHPGRKARSRSASRSPQEPETVQSTARAAPSSPLRPSFTSRESPVEPAIELDSTEINPPMDSGFTFHAVTAEEPIVLPSGSSTFSSAGSPSESPIPTQPESKKKERRGSFLGGWKLAMRRSSGIETGSDTPISDAPVGVGSGGGWVYRRRGSFSSPRPPTAEMAQHKSYAQEYKEFRNPKGSNNSARLSGASTTGPSAPATANTFAARAAAAGIKPSAPQQSEQQKTISQPSAPMSLLKTSGSTRKNFKEKMKSVEARFIQKHPEPAPPAIVGKEVGDQELVGLDVAVRQMGLLEGQLKSGRPLSPPDSREGERYKGDEETQNPHDIPVAPLSIVKINSSPAGRRGEEKAIAPSAGTSTIQPAQLPPCTRMGTKTLSPLRNQLDTSSSPPPKMNKGKAREGKGSIASCKHPSNSIYPPPCDYLGRNKTSGTGLWTPPTLPKPVAKLFVICCRCKYWHDLPSAMYRGMVENGGATRCPYCLHGMETVCCQGYTCVVYLHQRHH